ncbi:MAG: hypothetical protein O3A01_04470 [bacterium]|nr:hypothetical protein [bacterium]
MDRIRHIPSSQRPDWSVLLNTSISQRMVFSGQELPDTAYFCDGVVEVRNMPEDASVRLEPYTIFSLDSPVLLSASSDLIRVKVYQAIRRGKNLLWMETILFRFLWIVVI